MKPRSWATVPTRFSSEERREWKEWLEDDKGVDINKNRFTCAGPTSWGARVDDIDELYERMVKRGVVAAELALIADPVPALRFLPVRDTPMEAFRDAMVFGRGVVRVPAKKKSKGRK